MGGVAGYLLCNKPYSNAQAENYYKNLISKELIAVDMPKEQVQISLALQNVSSSSKYSIKILIKDLGEEEYREIGTTTEEKSEKGKKEIRFSTLFLIDYCFEQQQKMIFKIKKESSEYKFKCTLGDVMGSRGLTLTKDVRKDKKDREKIIISASTLKNNNININLRFSMRQAKEKNTTERIFYTMKKLTGKNQVSPGGQMINSTAHTSNTNVGNITENEKEKEKDYFMIYKSEVEVIGVFKNAVTKFEKISFPSTFLCNGNFDLPILIEFHSFENHYRIGAIETTMNDLLNKDSKFSLKGQDHLIVNIECSLFKNYTFLDYLKGGMQINLTIGIDFTHSNGKPSDPNSLHHISKKTLNSYEKAIKSCGEIVAHYDYDQLFPVYGYGAITECMWASHCFPLNFNTKNHNIKTIDGVLECYRKALKTIKLSGPTYFTPMLKQFMDNMRKEDNPMGYNILMILTNGVINDMDDTIDSLVEASYMPVSVIIIGIGNRDFGNMDILDADDKPLFDRSGRKAARDLVQFVPFYEFENDGKKLASQVLEEIPKQVVEYYKLIGMPPGDPIVGN
jgi:hypothetical protein